MAHCSSFLVAIRSRNRNWTAVSSACWPGACIKQEQLLFSFTLFHHHVHLHMNCNINRLFAAVKKSGRMYQTRSIGLVPLFSCRLPVHLPMNNNFNGIFAATPELGLCLFLPGRVRASKERNGISASFSLSFLFT